MGCSICRRSKRSDVQPLNSKDTEPAWDTPPPPETPQTSPSKRLRRDRSERSSASFGGFSTSTTLLFQSSAQSTKALGGIIDERSEIYVDRAMDMIDRLRRGEDIDSILQEIGMSGSCQDPCGSGNNLVVFYTDLEADDVMGIAQLCQWKRESEGFEGQPLVIQHANFDLKDHGTVFETKQLVARLMLGPVEIHVLTHEGDQGGTRLHDDCAHPQAVQLSQTRDQTISAICEKLAEFEGERIDFYILSPGAGNLASIIDGLEDMGVWPLPAEFNVSIYTGSFTMRGMHKADLWAINKMMRCSSLPLLDITKFAFFGGPHCHTMAASLSTFAATADFARKLSETTPLLAAALKLLNDESNKDLVHPGVGSLFDYPLDPNEAARFHRIKELFGQGDSTELATYAKALLEDAGLFAKVANRKKTTIRAFAYGGVDLALCSPLFFLYSWLRKDRPEWLNVPSGSWSYNVGTASTVISPPRQDEDGVALFDVINAVQPSLGDEAAVEQMGQVLESYFFKHLSEVDQQHGAEIRGNMCFEAPAEYFEKCNTIIERLYAGDVMAGILEEMGDTSIGSMGRHAQIGGRTLMVVYTDMEPDDLLSIAQLWQWKAEVDGMTCQPLIIQHANFDSKDHGKIFEMKELLTRLMLGAVELHVLSHEGDQGGMQLHDDVGHPKSMALALSRDSILGAVCEQLASFSGEKIEFYIWSPGSGNLAAIVDRLHQMNAWPLEPELHVSIYSGSFTMRGMHKADFEAIDKMMAASSSRVLVDINKFDFFGRDSAHPWSTDMATFAPADFAACMSEKSPMLAAALKLFNDEYVKHLINPESKFLFEKVLHGEERRRFESQIKTRWKQGNVDDVREYALALLDDDDLFSKVADTKKSSIRTFAHGTCSSPLCHQIHFLFEWLQSERPDKLKEESGFWAYDQAKGSTTFSRRGTEGQIQAVQPSLKDPSDTTVLSDMRLALWAFLDRRLTALGVSGVTVDFGETLPVDPPQELDERHWHGSGDNV
eukprot:TRINITY_DN55232_c0_g1_i1.p1 TRINITY_DN55232_c0_g1~~TRINITY_DN55232_c0_g1_i1.p1  ORF type:complete len:1003 (-),score=175.20 TRINITY_DN55232_c0_g1_i1:24-3032(-)